MSKARLVITAVVVEHRGVAEVARDNEVARSWVYELLKRYAAEGEAAFEPHSRRPRPSSVIPTRSYSKPFMSTQNAQLAVIEAVIRTSLSSRSDGS